MGAGLNYNLLKFLEEVNTDRVFSIVLAKTFCTSINFNPEIGKTYLQWKKKKHLRTILELFRASRATLERRLYSNVNNWDIFTVTPAVLQPSTSFLKDVMLWHEHQLWLYSISSDSQTHRGRSLSISTWNSSWRTNSPSFEKLSSTLLQQHPKAMYQHSASWVGTAITYHQPVTSRSPYK